MVELMQIKRGDVNAKSKEEEEEEENKKNCLKLIEEGKGEKKNLKEKKSSKK